jgi:pSer/pThr/pTyr-binding forkhead associated (FHA) protein
MDIRLAVEKGSTRLRTLHLNAPQTVIGRRHGCGLRIPSAQVSRQHCLLRIEDGGYLTVEDLNSSNGTYLNGRRISARETVCPGDYLDIGPLRFVAEYELTPAALSRLRRSGAATARQERLEDLPVAEEVFDLATGSQPLDVLPVGEEEAKTGLVKPAKAAPPTPAPKREEVLDTAVELDDAERWQLPESDELRDILTKLEESDRRPSSRPR